LPALKGARRALIVRFKFLLERGYGLRFRNLGFRGHDLIIDSDPGLQCTDIDLPGRTRLFPADWFLTTSHHDGAFVRVCDQDLALTVDPHPRFETQVWWASGFWTGLRFAA
jgi:hypothetical protein